jgi:hypothetical protein
MRPPIPAVVPALALLVASPFAGGAPAQTAATRLPAHGATPGGPSGYDPAHEFLLPYGLQNFSQHHVDALSTFLDVEHRYAIGDFAGAASRLDALWAQHPVGHPSWGALPTQPFGLNIGSPPCYYGLRMLTDMVSFRSANPGHVSAPRTARLTVLLVGETQGIEPRNVAEITSGGGIPVWHTLDPRVLADGAAAVTESLELFEEYVLAATDGMLAVETQLVPLRDVSLGVHAGTIANGVYHAGLVSLSELWAQLPVALTMETDWWWIVYPSHVPEQYPPFQNAEFITGGMGTGPDSISPCFIIDDRWLVRKPPHLGSGEMARVERRAYLPQWLQHEFFHHLFRTYPEFGLEATPHQWFDPASWPPDFQGTYEPDYYHQALHLRLATATPPLHVALRYATAGAPWDQITLGDLLGTYRREPWQNPWHEGDIQFGPALEWQNGAGVDWNLTSDLANGRLLTGPDCPYHDLWSGQRFQVVLERDALGDLTSTVRGFGFLGELYRRQ